MKIKPESVFISDKTSWIVIDLGWLSIVNRNSEIMVTPGKCGANENTLFIDNFFFLAIPDE